MLFIHNAQVRKNVQEFPDAVTNRRSDSAVTQPKGELSSSENEIIDTLKRQLGVGGATMMGLGSILGTGVFVSIGIAAGISGPLLVVAIIIGALVATCNALSSAQLAANHSVSGGTYEYGYKFLTPALGFTAGWMFLLAKSASAATAALGFAGYSLHLAGIDNQTIHVTAAILGSLLLGGIVLSGIRRSNAANAVIVSITILTLAVFILVGLPTFIKNAGRFTSFQLSTDATPLTTQLRHLLEASAIMFVAYTGYGRIATLGEEVRDPVSNIPRAIVATLFVSAALYVGVGVVGVGTVGADQLYAFTKGEAAPLEMAARQFGPSWLPWVVALGAVTAMLGVLLNLILGLSRVLLAMGRRGDMPAATARLNASKTTPYVAVIVITLLIAGLAAIGSVETTWSFSAFTVLIYYAITNLAATRLNRDQRLYPIWISWTGLIACLGLAFWVDWRIWLTGLALLGLGLIWHRFKLSNRR